jgi:hypothetical protein
LLAGIGPAGAAGAVGAGFSTGFAATTIGLGATFGASALSTVAATGVAG